MVVIIRVRAGASYDALEPIELALVDEGHSPHKGPKLTESPLMDAAAPHPLRRSGAIYGDVIERAPSGTFLDDSSMV